MWSKWYFKYSNKNEHIEELDKITKTEHNDLFDRLLLSQSMYEGMKFITHDRKFEYYDNENIIIF